MSGHSKWANIKHKKAKEDAKKGKEFTKLVREITIAAKSGGDPTGNPRLRHLIDEAKELNMPLENIQRAIKKGTGELPGVSYESITYEGHGPCGTAIIVEVLTDNKNRVVADLIHVFSRFGGNKSESGSVNWMFEKQGVIRTPAPSNMTEEQLFEQLIDFDIQDVSIENGILTVSTSLTSLHEVTEAIKKLGVKIEKSEMEWVAHNYLTLTPAEETKAFHLLEQLEEYDDVQNVFTNIG